MASAEPTLNIEALEALRLIECPVCMEVIYPPVYQCHHGHLVCSNCIERITHCPTCRAIMPEVRIRNLVVENLMTQKCPNVQWGCQMRLTPRDQDQHILNCKYSASDFCNRLGLGRVGLECNKIVRKCDISQHMVTDHRFIVIDSNVAVISQEISIDKGRKDYSQKWLPITFFAFDEHFFLDSEVNDDKNEKGATIFWKLICAGSVETAKQFSVKMILFNPNDAHSLKYQGNVVSIDKVYEKDSRYFWLPMDIVHQFSFSHTRYTKAWNIKIVIKEGLAMENHLIPPVQILKAMSIELKRPKPAASNVLPQIMPQPPPDLLGHLAGNYQYVSGYYKDWSNIIYTSHGENKWQRKVTDQSGHKTLQEYTFKFGEEFEIRHDLRLMMITICRDGNKLIRKEKHVKALLNRIKGEITCIEEFNGNEMTNSYTQLGQTRVTVYRKKVDFIL